MYAGEAAPYELHDPTEQGLINNGVIPSAEVPLVIQDKTFVPNDQQLAAEDPTWDKAKWGGLGNLWFPHVYMPNQNPGDISGAAPMGRWDYGPWFWPPYTSLAHGAIHNPYYDPVNAAWEPPTVPGTPTPSAVPEAFMDTPLVNGTAYPYLKVDRKAYRFRILNASNDRTLNLQLYYAKSSATMWNPDGTLNTADAGEVPMVAAVKTAGYPANWPTDGRDGGVPDPAAAGPQMIQIGNEGGLLPAPVPLPNQPVNYGYNRRDITVLNVSTHTLLLGPAERADVVVDFSQVPAGSKLILYNDAPAPVPAFDPRYDYYTGDPDQTAEGGAPTTLPGYGPNTRTVMQFQVQAGTAAPAFNLAGLQAAIPAAYKASQPKPIVPEKAYDAAFGTTTPADTYSRIQDTSLKWAGLTTPMSMQPKAIQELFDVDYGRMNSTLGTELPFTSATTQTTLPFEYIDPPTEIIKPSDLGTQVGSLNDGTQIWKITHNGVDTHAVHFHLFDVQVINRVGWDGAIRAAGSGRAGVEGHRPDEPAGGRHRGAAPVGAHLAVQGAGQCPAVRPDHAARYHHAVHRHRSDDREPGDGRQQDVRLRLGIRLALPPARPRGKRHDAADGLPGGADRAGEPGRLTHRGRRASDLGQPGHLPGRDTGDDPAGDQRRVHQRGDHLHHRRERDELYRLDRDRGLDVLLPGAGRERARLLAVV